MPDWCFNRVTVTGDSAEIQTFRAFVASDESPFDFDRIVPSPERLFPTGVPNHPGSPPYDARKWSYTFWGTHSVAFNASLHEDEEDDTLLEYHFDTKWSPASGIYQSLVCRFPHLSISWFFDEPAGQQAGYLTPDEDARGTADLPALACRLWRTQGDAPCRICFGDVAWTPELPFDPGDQSESLTERDT